jgi:hypothetical protein
VGEAMDARFRKSMTSVKVTFLIGISLVVASIPMASAAEHILFVGILIAWIAPSAFIGGIGLVTYSLLRPFFRDAVSANVIAFVITLLLGVNTRLPSLLQDATRHSNEMHVFNRLKGPVGQPLQIETNTAELTGRLQPYTSVSPNCEAFGCAITNGFRGPIQGLSGHYWRENIADTVLQVGFSKASAGERTPRIVVFKTEEADLYRLTLELKDEMDALLAEFHGVFRNGYPYESKDVDTSDSELNPKLSSFQFLAHGNPISQLFSYLTSPSSAPPLRSFLMGTSKLLDPRENRGIVVPVEIVDEKLYEPVWILRSKDDEKVKWEDLSYDPQSKDQCAKVLRPELKGSLTQAWLLFSADQTGRNKIPNTGQFFCKADAVWQLDWPTFHDKLTFTKYSVKGDLVYRIGFDEPSPMDGFHGHIMAPTFRSDAGYINFEWWNTDSHGGDRYIRRVMKVRLTEPQPGG